jgi:beta-phosphoglucomutase-like phosphatase (HAD superfamily)
VLLPHGDHRAFIYDCDGTLVDSMSLHFWAWRQALAEAGAGFEFSWTLFKTRAGMTLVHTVEELNRQFGERLDAVAVARRQHQFFAQAVHRVTPVDAVVAHARAIGDPRIQSVASGGSRHIVEQELVAIGVRELFSVVVCAEDVARSKPDPEMFLLCADRLGVAPKHCLVFEDSEFGIRPAEAAGMAWVRVADRLEPDESAWP